MAETDLGEVIAYHGWGFDATCWQDWRQRFMELGFAFKSCDRGYFGSPIQPNFTEAAPCRPYRLLLTHSYGLHWCPASHITQADLLVIFNGFAHFHPANARERRHSVRILNRMIDQFQASPETVLHQFRVNCYDPSVPIHAYLPLQQERLNHDLVALHTTQVPAALLKTSSPVLILQATQDRILYPQAGRELAQLLESSHSIEIAASHALPFTHLSTCWEAIAPFLTPLLDRPN
jgi:pimeloyl-[acyl-carrier protein] methyl ester esterase